MFYRNVSVFCAAFKVWFKSMGKHITIIIVRGSYYIYCVEKCIEGEQVLHWFVILSSYINCYF